MSRFTLGLALLVGCAACQPAAATTFYVAPDGNDAWSGASARPGAARTDGPFATLARARDAVRALSAKDAPRPPAAPVTVYLAGGVFRLDKTLEFTPQDSGTPQAPITYAAAPGQRPVLSGGRAITGWQKGEGSLWTASIPAVKAGGWYFHQLFVNGQRRTRARTPNVGYLYTEGILAPFDRAKWYAADIAAKRGFQYRPGDIRRWNNFSDALVVVYHSWTTSIHFITDLDEKDRAVHLAPPSGWPIGYWWEYNTRYHVENIREALDEPGEWYLDRATGVLTYWPMPGEDMTRCETIAPVVRQTLVAFKGEPKAGKYVEHLRFVGISFQHTGVLIAPDMPIDHQGAVEQLPLIAAEGLRHATFENCEIAHAGENGIWLGAGCTDNAIRHCEIHDLGGGAVFVGIRGAVTPQTAVERNVLDNNFIHDGSTIFRGSQGVWVGRASYNQVTHNEISDFNHLGVSVGFSWGYAPSTAHDNLIAFNHVHHICNGYFSDGGGIYTLGLSPGTAIRNNLVHDITPTPQMPIGATGIYLDEGSTDILVENNVVYRVGAGAFNQHYGKENLVRNNVFALAGRHPVCSCRPEEHLSFTFEGNIVLSDEGQATSDHFSPLRSKTAFKRNLYWDVSGKEPLFSGVSFAQWQKSGRDADSRIADPQFVDLAGRDFRLKPTSPALAMGFKPIEIDKVGLYGDADWRAGPGKIKRPPPPVLPPPPPPPAPRPMVLDFETAQPTKPPPSLPPGLHCSPADRPEAIRIVADRAAGGKQSLKLTKVAGLQYGFQPHVYYRTDRYVSGKARFACDVLNDPDHPADIYLGLRDYTITGREYVDGPVVRLGPDGSLSASAKALAKVPPGTWIHIEILLDLGHGDAAAPKTFRLTLTPAGQKAQVFDDLPYVGKEFSKLSWIGFSSVGKPDSVFYVDNFRLEIP